MRLNFVNIITAVFSVVRCLSVRPSVTLVDCTHTAEDIAKLLVRPGSPVTLVFRPRAPIPNSKREPIQRERKIHGVGKFCDFRLKSPFFSETVQHRSLVIMEG